MLCRCLAQGATIKRREVLIIIIDWVSSEGRLKACVKGIFNIKHAFPMLNSTRHAAFERDKNQFISSVSTAFAADLVLNFCLDALGEPLTPAIRGAMPIELRPDESAFDTSGVFLTEYRGEELEFDFDGEQYVSSNGWDESTA